MPHHQHVPVFAVQDMEGRKSGRGMEAESEWWVWEQRNFSRKPTSEAYMSHTKHTASLLVYYAISDLFLRLVHLTCVNEFGQNRLLICL